MFRFITANENGGARWVSGDSIDMFYVDYNNSEVKDNAGFELLGATELAVSGAALLISAVVMRDNMEGLRPSVHEVCFSFGVFF